MVYIYTINCPTTGLVRYVGKTKDTKNRFRKHLTQKNNTKKCRWITGLKNKGLKPVFEIIDQCGESDWQQLERGYIKLFKSIGANLLNELPGGEGGATMLGKNLTDEQKAKISKANTGKLRQDLATYNKTAKSYKINQYDLYGNYVATHDSIRDAAKAINRSTRRIQMMVTGKGKTVNQVGGYRFSMS